MVTPAKVDPTGPQLMPPELRSVTVDLGRVRGLVAGFNFHFCAVCVLEAEPRLKVFPNQGAQTRGRLPQAWFPHGPAKAERAPPRAQEEGWPSSA